jgi:carbamoyl-phosphate synthase large subunit
MMRRNILITSAGRRAKLLAAFQRELATLLPEGRVFGADVRPELSVACQLASGSFAVPPIDDRSYVPRLLEICREHEIALVVPTIDPELPVLAKHRAAFAESGVNVAVSDESYIQICGDKRKTEPWFLERGLYVPKTVDPRSATRFPLFAKPYDGSSGRDATVVNSPEELTPALVNKQRLMFSEYLSPTEHDEYSVDMYYDRGGVLRCYVPRLRIETRAGEVSKGCTRWIEEFAILGERLGVIVGARGCITLQLFVHRRSRKLFAMEVNPRFGGGFPLSYDAGANYPRWLILEYLQETPIADFDDWERDLTMLRYDDHVLIRGAAA